MTGSKQKQLLADVLEGLPSIVFILLWRQSGDLELAGWAGAGLALIALAGLRYLRAHMNPVLLGVNFHLLLATPVIWGLFQAGLVETGRLFAAHAHGAVLLTVTVTGLFLSLFSRRGFLAADLSPMLCRTASAGMLILSSAGACWALLVPAQSFLAVIATLSVLILGRRFVLATWADRANHTRTGIVLGASGGTFDAADMSA